MGFYGNITNTSNTTFQFDRIYPNRLSMDANTNNDGIFIGRYVLVEYDQDAAISNIYIDTDNVVSFNDTDCYFGYTLSSFENTSKIKYGGTQRTNVNLIDKYYLGEFGQVQKTENKYGTLIDVIEFYQCVGEQDGYALFTYVAKSNQTESEYIKNFAIDEEKYHEKKGYDSTVWVKTTEKNSDDILITKYVNIADLNSVVPTFDIATDAPTMEPIAAHFDADSTNVYYKLHVQQPFGFRVKEAEKDANSGIHINTDETTTYYITKYNKNKNETETVVIKDVPADIYFNEAGFQEFTPNQNVGEKPNFIKIEPSGKSDDYETKYSHTSKGQTSENKQVGDIQEFSLHLPAIGNMMSDAWDIIHGKQRNDYRGDGENASLQGRLDAFDAFYDNQIPVKRTNNGKIIGSRINGAAQYDNSDTWENEEKPIEVLYDTTSPNFNRDDAWIKTEVFTTDLKDGDKGTANDQGSNSGISIHHTFHATADSTSSVDKNIENGNIKTDAAYKSDKIQSNNLLNIDNKKDFIELYTPYVDAKGHVVGKNIETVTLPYGYKHFKTDGLSPKNVEGKDVVSDLYSTVNYTSTEDIKTIGDIANSSVAHNTQDTLTINPYNKWIQTKIEDTENNGDILTIAHEIHSIDERYGSNTNLNDLSIDNENEEGNLTIYDWDYDEAGHINQKRKHTYTLPYGFKTIEVGNDTTESAAPEQTGVVGETADNTQDTLTFTPTNKWIKMVATGDNKIKFGHELSDIKTEDNNATNLNIESTKSDSIIIPDWSYDAAGHITSKHKHEYILPYGYKSFTDGANTSTANSTQDEFTLVGDNWLQPIVTNNTITYKHIGPVSADSYTTKNNIENPKFGSQFEIEDWHFDSKGHKNNSTKHIIQFPKGNITHPTQTSNNAEIITSLSFDPDTGVISYQKDNSATLKLTTDYTNNGISAGNIAGGDSLNIAFAKLEKQIMQEANTRATDILKEASDRDTAIASAIAGIFDKNDDNEINKLAEIIEWINNNPSTATEMQTAIQENTNALNDEIKDREALQEQVEDLQNWKESATQDIENLNTTIEQLNDTISKLIERIEKLENPEIETQPDEQPENE